MPLVAFDFDGTLSDDEMVVLLGERAGCADAIAAITERAMRGELEYAESLRERVALLDGLSAADVGAALEGVRLRPGAADLLADLREAGVTTAILTGGFEDGVGTALDRAGTDVDRVIANRLGRHDDGALDGRVDGPLVEGTKDGALRELAAAVGVPLDETVAVGDGANDIPMLDVAEKAVGFRPKPTVRPHCDIAVESMEALRRVLIDRGPLAGG